MSSIVLASQKYKSLIPESWLRAVAPLFEGRMLSAGIVLLGLCTALIHILPEMGMYKLSREILTVTMRFSGLIFIAQCGTQMGLNLSRYGWAPKLTRLQSRYSFMRSLALALILTPAALVIIMADFAARDASYVAVIVAIPLCLLDYIAGRKQLQPVWFFPTMLIFRLWMVAALILGGISERVAFTGNQIQLIKNPEPHPFVAPVLESGEKIDPDLFTNS